MGCCKNLTLKKAKTIAKATKKFILSENEEIASNRLKICKKCPHKTIGVCNLCGCIVRLKVREETEKCPDIPSRW